MVMPAIAKPKDLRAYAIVPIMATRDPRLQPAVLQTLVAFCAYADRIGRTFVGIERIASDTGFSARSVSRHLRQLEALGYIVRAKPLHRQQRSMSRRIIYTPRKLTEDTIRSTLKPAELMELTEQESRIKAQQTRYRHGNSDEELGRSDLRERFSVLCAQFFRDAVASGDWWITEIQVKRAARALAEQAQGCLRRDRSAAEAPSSPLGYLDLPGDD